MPYLDGATAAQLMERMVNEGINPLNKAIQDRDVALAQLYKDYKSLRNNVGQSQGAQARKDLDMTKKPADHKHIPDPNIPANTKAADYEDGVLFRIHVSRELIIHLVKTGFLRPDQACEGAESHDKKKVIKFLRTLPKFIPDSYSLGDGYRDFS